MIEILLIVNTIGILIIIKKYFFNKNDDKFKNFLSDEFRKNRQENNDNAKDNRLELKQSITQLTKELSKDIKDNRGELSQSLENFEQKFISNIDKLNQIIKNNFTEFNQQQNQLNENANKQIKAIEQTIEKQLKDIRQDNQQQLSEMRQTVDEKLQTTLEKRLNASFSQVSERLEQVHKGLGEMQTVAAGVGDLKKVLSNVKTRGTLGEYQLEAILEQMLNRNQYEKNVATKKGSQANVEFAIKLPGQESDKTVWIPIDAKFPKENYERLIEAYDIGDKSLIETSQKALIKTIEKFAKDINDKYIDPPNTTDFAIMFLPVEGIFAEVLRHPGLFEKLQRNYKITVTGPTNLSAFLNSLQMGFRTLAVQKRSSEVWQVLKEVKSEFETFSSVFKNVEKQLNTASGTLEKLRTTRTNVMDKKLKNIENLEQDNVQKIS